MLIIFMPLFTILNIADMDIINLYSNRSRAVKKQTLMANLEGKLFQKAENTNSI